MLTEQNFIGAANIIGCTTAAIKAVTRTESGQSGFYGNGQCKIKYEGHIFHALTKGIYDKDHPTLSYPKWTEKYSAYGIDAYKRYDEAYKLNPRAAMMATSWGMFQVMGENYSSCLFKSVDEFVSAMQRSENDQLHAFCIYVKQQGLAKWLVMLKTAPEAGATCFALRYNGTGYKANHYDILIVKHYEEALRGELVSG